jgi:hypothetical protein
LLVYWLELLNSRDVLGDAAGALLTVEGEEAAVMEQQHPVSHVSHAGQLVGRDDRGGCRQMRLSHEPRTRSPVPKSWIVVDEEQTVGSNRDLVEVLGADEQGLEAGLDGTCVGATEAGEAVQQRGASSAARAEYRDAFAVLDVKVGTAQDPRANRAAFHSGGVALPQGAGA